MPPSNFPFYSGKECNSFFFFFQQFFFPTQSYSIFQDELGCKPAYPKENPSQDAFTGLAWLRHEAGCLYSSAFAFWSAYNPRSGRGWRKTLSFSWSPTLRTASFSHIQNDWEEIQKKIQQFSKPAQGERIISYNSERRFTFYCIPGRFKSAPHYKADIFVLAGCVWQYELARSAIRFHTHTDALLEPCFQGMGVRLSYLSHIFPSKLVRLHNRSSDSHGGSPAACATQASGQESHGSWGKCAAGVGESPQEAREASWAWARSISTCITRLCRLRQPEPLGLSDSLATVEKASERFHLFSWSSVSPTAEKDAG